MKFFIHWIRLYCIILCLTFVVGVGGCANLGTYNAATGQKEFIFISTDQEVSMGNDVHKQLAKQYKLSTNQAAVSRIERIGQKVAQVSDRQDYAYRFYLVEKDELNAFTTPGGNIYIFTGLVNKMKSDDEVAAVLAHEVGHCAARHTIKKFQAAMGYELIGGIILNQIGADQQVTKVASMSSNTIMKLVFSAYGRQDEYQADTLGLKYMYLAGYDLDAMIKTFEILKAGSKRGYTPSILRTHPHLEDRIVAVKKQIPAIKAGFNK